MRVRRETLTTKDSWPSSLDSLTMSKGHHVWESVTDGLKFRAISKFDPEESYYTPPPIFKKEFEEIVSTFSGRYLVDQQIDSASDEQLMDWATSNKEDSLALQVAIEYINTQTLARLIRFAESNLSLLAFHKLGGYIIQRLVARSTTFKSTIIKYMKINFSKATSNEYSSRILEQLVSKDRALRSFSLQYYSQSLGTRLTSFASVFVLSSAIERAENEEERHLHFLSAQQKRASQQALQASAVSLSVSLLC